MKRRRNPRLLPRRATAARRLLLGSALFAALLYAFTAAKPLHIDDPLYVFTARQMAAEFTEPYGFQINWEGFLLPATVYAAYHTPLWPAILTIPVRLAGEIESALHATQVPFVILAVFLMCMLARKWNARPELAGALLAFSPAFMVSATTLMPDVPCLALFMASLFCFIQPGTRRWIAPLGAVLFLGAGLMKLSIMPLMPVLAAAVWASGGPVLRPLSWLALATLALAAWPAGVLYFGGPEYRFDLLPSWELAWSARSAAAKFAHGLTTYATAVIHPGIWLILLGIRATKARLPSLTLITGIVLILASQLRHLGVWEGWTEQVWSEAPQGLSWLWASLGTLSFCCWLGIFAAEEASRGIKAGLTPQRLLLFWVACGLAGSVMGAPFPAVRYVLLGVPAVVILAVIDLNSLLAFRWGRLAVAAALTGTVWLGLVLTWADFKHAACARDLMAVAANEVRKAGGRGYLGGHWGFQYYGERLGIRTALALDKRINAGDLIMFPHSASRHFVLTREEIITEPLAILRCNDPIVPVRTMCQRCAAGFYGSGWLPYSFSSLPLDKLEVRRAIPK